MFLLIRYYSLTGYFVTDTETLKMEFYFLADLQRNGPPWNILMPLTKGHNELVSRLTSNT